MSNGQDYFDTEKDWTYEKNMFKVHKDLDVHTDGAFDDIMEQAMNGEPLEDYQHVIVDKDNRDRYQEVVDQGAIAIRDLVRRFARSIVYVARTDEDEQVRVPTEGAEHNLVTKIGNIRIVEKDEIDFKDMFEIWNNDGHCILHVSFEDMDNDNIHVEGTNFHDYEGPLSLICYDLENVLRILTRVIFVNFDL